MTVRPNHSIDGFIPRRQGTPLDYHQGGKSGHDGALTRLETAAPSASRAELDAGRLQRSQDMGLTREDIDKTLRDIDDTPAQKNRAKPAHDTRRIIRRAVRGVAVVLVVIVLSTGGWLGYKALKNVSNVFGGSVLGLVQKKPLKQDANGRSNVLLFGTSEDSDDHNANGGAGGPLLTDSIMVLSVNQEKKDAFMISIPRDLWIKFDEPCLVGYQEKINSVYQCGSDFGEDPAAGAAALQKKVGEVLGLDIQYYGQVDYSVVTRAVDAVGGVDVTIESNPSGMGILDRNFDWKCNYQCFYVKYEDGEKVHLNGEYALALSRARNAQGGYGLAGGNFDREKNQQKILKALREKALSVGTLTNVGKVTELLDAFGDNLKTNVDKSEVQTIMALANDINTDAIVSLNLRSEESPLVTTGPVGNASAVYPLAGLFDYSDIKAYIAKASSTDPFVREGATVAVLNGSGVAGAAQTEADKLIAQGFEVIEVGNAPAGEHTGTQVYQNTPSMAATKAKLASIYGVTVSSDSSLQVGKGADFVVILGKTDTPS